MTIERTAVIGLGHIGGSLALRASRTQHVVGYDADPGARAGLAERLGADHVADDVATAVRGADLVVLAVPLPVLPEVAAALGGYHGLVTDVTSVKGPVRDLIARHRPGTRWVGGHPMAGREASGFGSADAELLAGCAWALCLEKETALEDWLAVASWVLGLDARVVPVTAAEHDTAVARVSHVEHVVAAALTLGAADGPGGPLALGLGAGSFRDATRVAGTRPALTAAMCGGNATALVVEIDALQARLTAARQLLTGPDPVAALTDWLQPAFRVRADWPGVARLTRVTADRRTLLALARNGGHVIALTPDGAATAEVRSPDV